MVQSVVYNTGGIKTRLWLGTLLPSLTWLKETFGEKLAARLMSLFPEDRQGLSPGGSSVKKSCPERKEGRNRRKSRFTTEAGSSPSGAAFLGGV